MYDRDLIEEAIKQVIKEMKIDVHSSTLGDRNNYGIFDTMDEAIEESEKAWNTYHMCSMEDRKKYIDAIRSVVLKRENLSLMSKMTVEETGIGNYQDKVIKNSLAAAKSPGIEDLVTEAVTGDQGMMITEYCPFGVIGAICPTTNPTETIICNSIGMLAGGNTVVFSPHPRSTKTSHYIIKLLNEALEEAGAPKNLITTVKEPSIENTNKMMNHPKVRMLVATGGPGIVKTVMSTGKKAIGAGAGNPPVVVDETANIEKAARDIVLGCSFDNNVPCTAEKEVFVVDKVADFLISQMKDNGAYEIKDPMVVEELWKLVSNEKNGPKVDFVGKSAKYILAKLGINVSDSIKIIIMETNKNHPFVVNEMLMPILPIVRVENVDEGIDLAVIAENGNRHTAIMHSTNITKLSKMAKLIQATIFVKNAPSYAGIGGTGGMGYATFTIAGPTGEGLTSARSFCRKRRCVMSDSLHIR